jgi:UDP-N-acetylglucosamine--N-acetylmuramyl-(pentapeptide) pyrophosphoryl-undecaprenol N-acetylglucosamine transferase
MALRVLIAGGGTGGHVIPALAIADELRTHYQAEVRFVGTARGFETKLVPQAGYKLELIQVGQLKSVSLRTRVRTILDLPLGVRRSLQILDEFKPHVVVGVGGYASGPGMIAAILKRIPTLAFEPNAAPGLANRLVGKRVSAAAVSFPPATKYFRNAQVTGIPVRKEFFALSPRPVDAKPNLLVFGGSQGARIFNTTMPKIAATLLAAVPELTILHQAGERQAEATLTAYQASQADPACWQVQPFLEDMPKRFEAADLVLARSGASTVAELAAAGKPAVLVPFPQATDDHQRKNAEVMAKENAAVLILESNLSDEVLLETLTNLLTNKLNLTEMAKQAKNLARHNAAADIAAMVANLAKGVT